MTVKIIRNNRTFFLYCSNIKKFEIIVTWRLENRTENNEKKNHLLDDMKTGQVFCVTIFGITKKHPIVDPLPKLKSNNNLKPIPESMFNINKLY